MLRGMCDLSNSPTVRFRYRDISALGQTDMHQLRKKKGPAEAGPWLHRLHRVPRNRGSVPQQDNSGRGRGVKRLTAHLTARDFMTHTA
jgi:hypothetical protein